jgi:hypothetical protein
MGRIPVALGVPGPIRFPAGIAHHWSPYVSLTTGSIIGGVIIALHVTHGNYRLPN